MKQYLKKKDMVASLHILLNSLLINFFPLNVMYLIQLKERRCMTKN